MAHPVPATKATPREQAFAGAYVRRLAEGSQPDGTRFSQGRAAQDAGYSPQNPKAAAVVAVRLLKRPRVQAAIEQAKVQAALELGYDPAKDMLAGLITESRRVDGKDTSQSARVGALRAIGDMFHLFDKLPATDATDLNDLNINDIRALVQEGEAILAEHAQPVQQDEAGQDEAGGSTDEVAPGQEAGTE